jgi:HK97 gp10 family phage protein
MLTAELKGVGKLKAKFKVFGAGIQMSATALPKEIAENIAEVARELVAVDTGRTSMNVRVRASRGGAVVVVTRGGQRDEVPAYLEFGTHKMAARPFLKPAADLVVTAAGLKRAVRSTGGLIAPTRRL